MGHLAFEAAAVLFAASAFDRGATANFMAGVVLSRVGLYGFDVGFMELQQRQVRRGVRSASEQRDGRRRPHLLGFGVLVDAPSWCL